METKPLGFDVGQAEQFVESFRGETVDEEEVAMLREMVYRVVKVEYRHMVETGELPRTSTGTLTWCEAAAATRTRPRANGTCST